MVGVNQSVWSQWSIIGNGGTSPGTNFIGTTDAKDLVFKTFSTEVMRINQANSRVGIGTTTPGQKLTVYGGRMELDNTSAGQSSIQFSSAGSEKSVLYRPSSTVDLRLWGTTLGADVMTWNTTSGNVGIGITSPSYLLDVNGDVNGGGSSTSTTNAFRLGTNKILWHNGHVEDMFVGVSAGNATMTGHYNTLIGNSAGKAITTGTWNTAIGYQAMNSNTICMYNTAIGYQALYTQSNCPKCWDFGGATNSATNTAVGYQALYSTAAYGGCALGYNAGFANTSGCSLVAIGESAAASNTTGDDNVAVGGGAGVYNQTGKYNTCVGDAAGAGVLPLGSSNNSNNSFFGANSGTSITTGNDNAFVGRNAGYTNNTGSLNTFVGDSSGYKNTSGTNNVFMGFEAGYSNTTAINNVFVGNKAGKANISGTENAAFGNSALVTLATGDNNVAIGNYAMRFGSGCIRNTACGYTSLYNTTSSTGNYNSALGYGAGTANTTGGYNTFIGNIAGATYTTGSNNTFVGNGTDANANSKTNATAIGNGAIVTASNKIRLGDANVTVIEGTVGYTISDGRFKTNIKEEVKGLEFIKKLHPVNYNFDTKKFDEFLIKNMPDSVKERHTKGVDFTASTAIIHSGFIAQEVEQAAKDCGFTTDIVHKPDDENDNYSVAYGAIVVPLVKAVQELSKASDSLKTKTINQDSINRVLKKQIDSLSLGLRTEKTKVDSINTFLQNEINQLTSIINSCCSSGAKTTNNNNGNNTNGSGTQTTTATNVTLNNAQTIVLEQNVPNPFAEQTTINYSLPDNTGKAQMLFYNSDGKLIQSVELNQKGQGQLNVFASDLSSGIYTYTLVVDGKIVETKKMVKQ